MIAADRLLAGAFADRFDGFSVGSSDLTQRALGLDHDVTQPALLHDECDEAAKRTIASAISGALEGVARIGLCGQALSDHPDFSSLLVEQGSDSISVSPDRFVDFLRAFAEAEGQRERWVLRGRPVPA
jgi:pyruvate,water dikinase